jgi:very-short-patch-repair endonuclease
VSAKKPPLSPQRWARFRRLLAYYLDCVQEDRQQEICFARDGRRTDHVFLALHKDWSLLEGSDAERPFPMAAAPLLSRTRLRGETAQLFYGYPVLASWEPAEDGGRPACFLLPLFTQPVDFAARAFQRDGGLPLTLRPDWPRVNREGFGRLFGSTAEQDEVLEQLGLLDVSPDSPPVRISDAVRALARLDFSLPLLEPLDPERLVTSAYAKDGETGVLNRAVLFAAEPSRYTAGLERELREVAKLSDAVLERTALAQFFCEAFAPPPAPEKPRAIVEVSYLNGGQRRACEASLNAPLTVVTGPPGTGKSQVVLNVLANAFLQGASAVFSSRNHKAVQVVEERLDRLTAAPIIFRLGSQGDLASRLGQVLARLLSFGGSPSAAKRRTALEGAYALAVAGRSAAAKRIGEVLQARNQADQLDRALEPWRRKLSAEQWRAVECSATSPDSGALKKAVRLISLHAPGSGTRRRGLLSAIRRPFDLLNAARTLETAYAAFPVLGPVPAPTADGTYLDAWLARAMRAVELANAQASLRKYTAALDALSKLDAIDEIAFELDGHRAEAARLGAEILELHRADLGGGLGPHDRTVVAELLAITRNLAALDPGSREAWRLRKQVQERLPRVTRFLPTWAVTSLSAPGALPFEAGLFDLAVIDEASQCDIPSAIPLLYRSRRAVVIGDPQQLRHVTTLPPPRANALATTHGLTGAADQPFTFVANSLYDLAAASAGAAVFALEDHYRSHADIVGFSNAHWYGKELRIVTDYCGLVTPVGESPGIVWTQVESHVLRPGGGGALAPEEAARVVEEVTSLLERKGFNGSVGVVSPFRAQANRIREALAQRLAPEMIQRVELVANTAHGLQGDERDVVFFSPCMGAPMPPGARKFLAKTANLFNVAVTRARAQLRVVGDLGACEACGIPHVESFARHYRALQSRPPPTDDAIGIFEKPLEEALRAAGVIAIPQYAFGRYRLDLAVVEGEVRLAIEVDGEHFHKDLSGERCWEDLNRDYYLTKRGWRVLRFWAVEVRDRLPGCVERVTRTLEAMRCRPQAISSNVKANSR